MTAIDRGPGKNFEINTPAMTGTTNNYTDQGIKNRRKNRAPNIVKKRFFFEKQNPWYSTQRILAAAPSVKQVIATTSP